MHWLIQAVNGLDKHGNTEHQVMWLINILSLVILNMYILDESRALQRQPPFQHHHHQMRIIPNCLLVACSIVNTVSPVSQMLANFIIWYWLIPRWSAKPLFACKEYNDLMLIYEILGCFEAWSGCLFDLSATLW